MTGKSLRGAADFGEVFLPFSHERSRIPPATHIRSTLIASSVDALRSRGLLDEYRAHLDREHRDVLPNTVAGSWLPISHGIAHYEGCDRLRLTTGALLEIGENVTDRMRKSALSLAVKLAVGSGVTPWTIFLQGRRLWERSFRGGSSLGVFKLGPKEARLEIVAWPLARIEYNRVSFRGILRGLLLPFSTQTYVHELTPLCSATTSAYRVAWA
jgi:hypothetical protein